jgi:hypothetical protein
VTEDGDAPRVDPACRQPRERLLQILGKRGSEAKLSPSLAP